MMPSMFNKYTVTQVEKDEIFIIRCPFELIYLRWYKKMQDDWMITRCKLGKIFSEDIISSHDIVVACGTIKNIICDLEEKHSLYIWKLPYDIIVYIMQMIRRCDCIHFCHAIACKFSKDEISSILHAYLRHEMKEKIMTACCKLYTCKQLHQIAKCAIFTSGFCDSSSFCDNCKTWKRGIICFEWSPFSNCCNTNCLMTWNDNSIVFLQKNINNLTESIIRRKHFQTNMRAYTEYSEQVNIFPYISIDVDLNTCNAIHTFNILCGYEPKPLSTASLLL